MIDSRDRRIDDLSLVVHAYFQSINRVKIIRISIWRQYFCHVIGAWRQIPESKGAIRLRDGNL